MVTLVKFIAWMFSAVSARTAAWWGRGIGFLLHALLGKKRELARQALRESFPEWPEERVRATARAVFRTQGLFAAEVLRMFGQAKDHPLDHVFCSPENLAFFDGIIKSGQGVLVLTGHVNNYELLMAWAGRKYGLTVVAKLVKPPKLGEYINQQRSSHGVTMLPNRGSYRDVLRAVKGGGTIGFIMDQNMKHHEGAFVTFFGKPACTTPGLAMLSAHAQAPVMPVFLIREGDGYRVRAFPVIPPPPDRDPATLQQFTQRYSNVMEEVIREQPESWIWMHKRWNTKPKPGDAITAPDGTIRHA